MSIYATVQDIQELKRPLTAAEQARAEALLPVVSSLIRYEAKKTGRDFDEMIMRSELCPCVDEYEGNGELLSFTLSYKPNQVVSVTVNGAILPSDAFAVVNNEITFTDAPNGHVVVLYDYRALADVARGVTCDIVMRELNTPGNMLPTTSYSEGAGNMSQSFSLPNSSGSIKLWPSDLKALGLKRQKIDSLDLWTNKQGLCFPPPRRLR